MYLACLVARKKNAFVPDLLFADEKTVSGHCLARKLGELEFAASISLLEMASQLQKPVHPQTLVPLLASHVQR